MTRIILLCRASAFVVSHTHIHNSPPLHRQWVNSTSWTCLDPDWLWSLPVPDTPPHWQRLRQTSTYILVKPC